jgi:hypothetical protein
MDILDHGFNVVKAKFKGMTIDELKTKRSWLEVERDCAERLNLHDKYHETSFDLEVVQAEITSRGIQ